MGSRYETRVLRAGTIHSMLFSTCLEIKCLLLIYVITQGDRSKKVGVVDSEYIVHKGIQSLGGSGHPTMRTTMKVLALPPSLLVLSVIFSV